MAVQVWVTTELDREGKVRLHADSDSQLTKGMAAVVVAALSGLSPEELLQVGLPLPCWASTVLL